METFGTACDSIGVEILPSTENINPYFERRDLVNLIIWTENRNLHVAENWILRTLDHKYLERCKM